MKGLLARYLLLALLLCAFPLALVACGGSEQSIKGQVLAVDLATNTFSVQAEDGKRYDFKPKAGGEVDMTHIKEHMDEKKSITVRFTGTSAPYEASYAH